MSQKLFSDEHKTKLNWIIRLKMNEAIAPISEAESKFLQVTNL